MEDKIKMDTKNILKSTVETGDWYDIIQDEFEFKFKDKEYKGEFFISPFCFGCVISVAIFGREEVFSLIIVGGNVTGYSNINIQVDNIYPAFKKLGVNIPGKSHEDYETKWIDDLPDFIQNQVKELMIKHSLM